MRKNERLFMDLAEKLIFVDSNYGIKFNHLSIGQWGIQIADQSGVQMVESSLVVKWFRIQMAFKYQTFYYLNTGLNLVPF